MGKAEIFNVFCASAFKMDDGLCRSQHLDMKDHGCRNNNLSIKPELEWDLLLQVYAYKSMEPGGINPRILKELAGVITKHLSMTLEGSWKSGELPAN